jgi:hypothetical protein
MGNMNRAPRCCKVTPAATYLSRMRLDWRWAFAGDAERNAYQPLTRCHTWRRMGILDARRYDQHSLQQEVLYGAAKHCGHLNRKSSPICVPCRALALCADLVSSRPYAYYCSVYTIMSSQACFHKQYNCNRLQLHAIQRRDCMHERNPKIFVQSLKRNLNQGRLSRLKNRLLRSQLLISEEKSCK